MPYLFINQNFLLQNTKTFSRRVVVVGRRASRTAETCNVVYYPKIYSFLFRIISVMDAENENCGVEQ